MRLRMWTYDLAREQSPSLDNLRSLFELTLASGYNAIGLYMEHRFAYPSTPWSHGTGAVTPEMVRTLQEEFPELQVIPFLNLLGHMEGMIYTEYGRRFAEERFRGMQACPSNPDTVDLANGIVADALEIFKSEIIHIGGDETQQLAACPRCRTVGSGAPMRDPADPLNVTLGSMKTPESTTALADQKARLYARHFAPLARRVVEAGRRPAIWGDMILEHHKAALAMPRETLIFDWQYFQSPVKTSKRLMDDGFEVVCCPTLQTYNAAWLHLDPSEKNVCDHVQAASELGAYGVCVTTWENALFGSYETLLPAIQACGAILNSEPEESAAPEVPSEQPRFALFENISFLYHGELEGVEDWHIADQAPAVKYANAVISRALREGSKTVRLEPGSVDMEVRFDEGQGTMVEKVPRHLKDPFVNRVRLLAGLPVGGRRIAQKGFIAGRHAGVSFRFEVKTMPVDHGMRVTLTRDEGAQAQIRAEVQNSKDVFLDYYGKLSDQHREWARLMGVELASLGGVFAHSQIRSSLKVRLLMQGNPFMAWLYHGEELSGDLGSQALVICDRALQVAADPATRGVTGFIRCAIEFVRYAEQAHQAYANELPGVATASLAPARQVFEELEKIAKASNLRFGGSMADVYRARAAKSHVELVAKRIKEYGDGVLGYLPSFEHLTHPKFVPHDQGAWWLINRWAHE